MNDSASPHHHWIRGGLRDGRQRVCRGLALPPGLAPVVDCHRRLRGPYTGAGALARAITPGVLRRAPGLVRRHDIELLSAAPELSTIVPNSRETLASLAIPTGPAGERTRFHARLRTRRIANGLVEFVRDSLADSGAASLVLENVDHADETDLEFLASALRRIDPAVLTIVVCSGARELPDPVLAPVLGLLAVHDAGEPGAAGARGGAVGVDGNAAGALARAYVWSDCTSDDPAQLAGYQALEPGERAALHDERAAGLAGTGEPSLRLGALPHHLARGADPAGAGAGALQFALDHCVCLGFYSAAVELGQEGLWLTDPATQRELWWQFAMDLGLALSMLSRTHEALRLYDTARLLSIDPAVHMAAAYSTAMLYARHNDPAECDEKKAKAWLNSAIATASLISDRAGRAFQSAFYRNGLALVEVDLGEPAEALRLVNECIAILDQQLTPDERRLHRSALKNSRARVLAGLGRLDEALADYAVVIADDPNHAEHYLERGNVLRSVGRHDEAFADYATAMKLSPPFPEIYYSRGDLRLATGDLEGALDDFSYVLDLDPECVAAYLGRASIYLDDGEVAAAEADVLAGLHCDAGNAYLQSLLGQVCLAKGNVQAAIQACKRATAADPGLQEAWACQGRAFFEAGAAAQAVASLDRALEIGESALLLFNRSAALQAAGRWAEALADAERASELEPGDSDIAESLACCRERLAAARPATGAR